MSDSMSHSIDLSMDAFDINSITLGSIDSLNITSTATPGYYVSGSLSDTISLGAWDNSVQNTGRLELQGNQADIVVNGESLMQVLRLIQSRLDMLVPNPRLEAEWDDLRELGDRYRELERQLEEKSKMWQTLNSMPPPKID